MARSIFMLVALTCWLPDPSLSQNGCQIDSTCRATGKQCLTMENVALGKIAEISSFYNESGVFSPPACVVVNGNRDNWFAGSGNADNCAHTNTSDYTGWWQVHLGRNYTIKDITVYSQVSGELKSGYRLSEVRVTIDGGLCYDFPSRTSNDGLSNISCNTPLTGSTVRFEKRQRAVNDAYYLVLCEVEIWVCKAGLFGPLCDKQCSGYCKENDTCDNYYGTCPRGCADGYYTVNCSEKCGLCLDVTCNIITGECVSGCQSGWQGTQCNESCPDRYYGPNCIVQCGHCLNNGTCNMTTGKCQQGCDPGWTSVFCNQSATGNDAQSSTPIIVGIVVPCVVILVVVTVVVLILRRRQQANQTPQRENSSVPSYSGRGEKHGRNSRSDTSRPKVAVKPMVVKTTHRLEIDKSGSCYENIGLTKSASLSSDRVEWDLLRVQADDPETDPEIYDDKLQLDDAVTLYRNDTTVYGSLKKVSTNLDSVQQFLVDRLASGEILMEFKELPKGLPLPHHTALIPINKRKNRYASVVPYEHNRVVLSDGYTNNNSTDYVNASYIRGCHSDKQYIAAQAPRVNTVTDFWRMVWQERVTQLVVLTSLVENGKSKCYEYWPSKDTTQTYGPLTVTGLDVQCRAFYFIRTFRLNLPGSPGDLEVTQYHFLGWPDHGVPIIASLVEFWRYVRVRTVRDTFSPLLVHCSAGVGRTGTFIGLDIAMDRIEEKRELNILDIVLEMRLDKTLMVQAPEQYVFLHKAILEAHTGRNTMVNVQQFNDIFPRTIIASNEYQRIDQEFQTLKQMQSLVTKQCYDVALQEKNKRKNRNQDVLPDNDHLVYLTELTSNNNQYINAVYMPDFCQYWPVSETKSVHVEPYTLKLKSSSKLGEHLTSYTVNMEKNVGTEKPRDVCLLRYTAWTDAVPSNTPELLLLVDKLDTSNSIKGNNPVIIQCLDGGSKSALFCVIRDVISHITYDREVDVYMVVRKVQNIRPRAVTSEIQYRYCYQVAQQKIKELNIYANI